MKTSAASQVDRSISLRSVFVVTLFSVGQLLALFVLQLVLANYFGASAGLDAFMAAQAIPLLVGAVLAGSLGSVIIPLSHELHRCYPDNVVETTLNRLGWILIAVSTVIAFLLFLGSTGLTSILYPEFPPPQKRLCAAVLRNLCWLVPINTATGFLYSVFHARESFFPPALISVVGPVVTVVTLLLYSRESILAVSWAVLLGGAVGVLLLCIGFPRAHQVEELPLRPVLCRFGHLIVPLMLGAAYFRMDAIVDRHLASGLSAGSISQLGYAWRLISAVTAVATSGLAVVAFPTIARHAALRDEERLAGELAQSWRFLCVVVLPIIGGIVAFSPVLVACLLQRGAFTPEDTTEVAQLMTLYVGALFAAGVGEIATRTFYALGRTWIPTLIGMTGFTIGAVGKFAAVPALGTTGLALITSAYYLINAACLVWVLRRLVRGAAFAGLAATLCRTLLCSIVALGVAALLLGGQHWSHVLCGVSLSIVCYVILQRLLGDEFARRLFRWLFRRVS